MKKKATERKGKVTKTVRLSGKKLELLRWDAYFRSNGACELRTSPKCWKWASWEHGHMAHIKSRGAGGSDTIDNVRWACRECHIGWEHNGGKPCPPKPKQEARA